MSLSVCVCVCVCERERERDLYTQRGPHSPPHTRAAFQLKQALGSGGIYLVPLEESKHLWDTQEKGNLAPHAQVGSSPPPHFTPR